MKNHLNPPRRALRKCLQTAFGAALLSTLLGSPALAQTAWNNPATNIITADFNTTGTGSFTWSDGNAWVGGSAPVNAAGKTVSLETRNNGVILATNNIDGTYTVGSLYARDFDGTSVYFNGTGKFIFDNGANPSVFNFGRWNTRFSILRPDLFVDLQLNSDLDIRMGAGRCNESNVGRIGKTISGNGKLTLTLGINGTDLALNRLIKIGNGGANSYAGGTEVRWVGSISYGTGSGMTTVAQMVDALATGTFGTGNVNFNSQGMNQTNNTALSTTNGGLQVRFSANNVMGPTAKLTQSGDGAGLVLLESTQQSLGGLETTGTTAEQGRKRISSTNAAAALTLNTQPAASYTYGGVITGPLSLAVSGSGTQILAGTNTYAGLTTISGGTLQLGDGTANNGAVAGNIANNGTLVFANPVAQTFNGVITGTGALVKSGAGTLTLNGGNNFSGDVSLSAGTLVMGSSSALGSGNNLSIGSGTTLNVTALTASAASYALPAASLRATSFGQSGLIVADATGTVDLGTKPITLNYDGSNPALVVSQGTLSLSGQTITVNTALPLGNGDYNIIAQTSGNIAALGALTLAGNAVPADATGELLVVGGNVVLRISNSTTVSATTVTWSGGTSQTYGTAHNAGVSVASPGANGTVQFYANGAAFGSPVTPDSLGFAAVPVPFPAVGSYVLTAIYSGTSAYGPSASVGTRTLTITPKALTALGTLVFAPSKVYDGRTLATPTSGAAALQAAEAYGEGSSTDGKPYNGDTISLTGTAAYAYNIKDVATATTITASGLSLTGSSRANYTLTAPAFAATITPKDLTAKGTIAFPATKVYDGTNSVSAPTGTHALLASEAVGTGSATDGKPYTPDTVTLTGTAIYAYNSKNVADGTNVVTSGLTLTATVAGNYTLVAPVYPATITPKALTALGDLVFAPKAYDGTSSATPASGAPALQTSEDAGTGTTADGKPYTGDAVTLAGTATYSYNSRDVASATTITVAGLSLTGAEGGNYSLSAPSAPSTITLRPITVTAQPNTKVFDGNTTAAAIPLLTAGTLAENETGTYSEVYATADVGTGKTLIPAASIKDAALVDVTANYNVTLVSDLTGVISSATVTPPTPVITSIVPGPGAGQFTIHGTADKDGTVSVWKTTSLTTPNWVEGESKSVTATGFDFVIPASADPEAFFKLQGKP